MVDHALEDQVTFRNVAFDDHRQALEDRGGDALPALWDGAELHQGAERILSRLSQLVDLGRSP